MKITALETIRCDSFPNMLWVQVHTDEGLTGLGEVHFGPGPIETHIHDWAAQKLIGRDPTQVEAAQDALAFYLGFAGTGAEMRAHSALDIALWDIRGKHFGAPVHVLMGGPLRSEVKAYATGLYRRSMDQDENIAILSEEAGGYINQGFGAMKLKVGFGFDYDMTLIEILRGIIGFDVDLFMDANHGYDLVQAKKLALAAEAYDIGWFEEPVAPEDLESYRELRRITTIPIAGGECSFTRFDFRAILESPRAMDIIQPDTASAGGLTECKKIADMAVAHGARYNPHVWGTGIGLATAMQLLAVLPLTVPGVAAHVPMLEYDQTPHPFRQGLLVDPIQVENGVAYVPEGPGLGVEIKRDVLERYKVN